MTDLFDHQVSSTTEKRGTGANEKVRHRGRCSCGHTTHLHYSTQEAARTALRLTHIAILTLNERTTA
jgi:short subunit dehydrogenase-like uncharacterized protein